MGQRSLFTVAFDVSCNRLRYRVVKVLLGYGERAQKSVFECRLDSLGFRRLQTELQALKWEPSDRLHIYTVDRQGRRILLSGVVTSEPGRQRRKWVME